MLWRGGDFAIGVGEIRSLLRCCAPRPQSNRNALAITGVPMLSPHPTR
jgi:hypothetical protein